MSYREFNQKVLEFYISRSRSSFFTLSIDQYELEEQLLVHPNFIKEFFNLKANWATLLISWEDVPQYFGLLAIQCYAASLMERDNRNEASAYNVRLCQTLDISTETLQSLYRGDDAVQPAQEAIWYAGQNYLQAKYGLYMSLPACIQYAGRFVQFPKSQTLLNTEDLKRFRTFFKEEFQVNENIDFSFFKNRLEKRWRNLLLSKRAEQLCQDQNKQEQCYRQIFNYYLRWNGEVDEQPYKRQVEGKPDSLEYSNGRLYLVFEQGTPKFFIEGAEYRDVDCITILRLSDYKYIHNNLIILNESEYYPNEFEDSRFLLAKADSCIVLNREARPKEASFLDTNNCYMFDLGGGVTLYRVAIHLKHPLFIKYYSESPEIKLEGGLRLSRKREYLQGFGPDIVAKSAYAVLKNNSTIQYDPEQAEEGWYKVRTENWRDVEFAILAAPEQFGIISSRNKGWKLRSYSIDDEFDIEGCFLTGQSHKKNSSHREWINLLTPNNRGGNLNRPTNILLKALKNAKG